MTSRAIQDRAKQSRQGKQLEREPVRQSSVNRQKFECCCGTIFVVLLVCWSIGLLLSSP